MSKIFPCIVALSLASACSDMSDTQQRTLTGGLGGAAGGAVIGAIGGNAGMGAAIGAGVGLVGGYLYDQHEKSKEAAYYNGLQQGQQQSKAAR